MYASSIVSALYRDETTVIVLVRTDYNWSCRNSDLILEISHLFLVSKIIKILIENKIEYSCTCQRCSKIPATRGKGYIYYTFSKNFLEAWSENFCSRHTHAGTFGLQGAKSLLNANKLKKTNSSPKIKRN